MSSLTYYSLCVAIPFFRFWFENDILIQVRYCHLLGVWCVFYSWYVNFFLFFFFHSVSLRSWSWFSFLNWIGALTLSLWLKLSLGKMESWFALWSFFFLRSLSLLIDHQPYMEYCGHVWTGTFSCYLKLLDELQKRICRTAGPSPAGSLELLAHCRNIASSSLFYRYYFGSCSFELA